MQSLHDVYEIEITDDKLKAFLKQSNKREDPVSVDELKAFIRECGVCFGVKEDVLGTIIESDLQEKILIAEGTPPIKGEDAFLKPEILTKEKQLQEIDDDEPINLREVMEIPSVSKGTVIGVKVERTAEINGTNVLGQEIKAQPGRDLKLRQGKNTRVSEDGKEIVATLDGQLSIEPKVIHVYPVYEVNGDLDLKVGNIDFVGNVNIRGNVPAGFKIVAKGDIRVRGSVEAAELIAGGSIFVEQGIVAQGKGLLQAKGDLHTSFINQGIVKVEGDVHVSQSILHSTIHAQGNVYCKERRGNIVGGNISAVKGIEVNEVGNSMSTPTSLYLGISQEMLQKQKQLEKKLKQLNDENGKLELLQLKLTEKEKAGLLKPQERIMKLRIRNTMIESKNNIDEINEELLELQDVLHSQNEASIRIYKDIFTNCDIFFGKYRRKIVSKHHYVMFKLDQGEIVLQTL
ncbi:DUF342 domain-containing protein [Evansella cellulosilytica]|uniref:Flagellar Assembly Protein A N-terminal region domain-containing protein n=1 Tax=Evansella cellulosilytica (strain ATCC 21833 / DSM 2522 / FERM P-1141 / JCM 9156 / N-4) TaxID=649639 RepID=E6TST8_EVAC2|nr:FapA family protein [Evansella cellulosilytica]ADU30730.1 protein of unknown function DUF342 [Evansella cellulosilytica DSM 2522]